MKKWLIALSLILVSAGASAQLIRYDFSSLTLSDGQPGTAQISGFISYTQSASGNFNDWADFEFILETDSQRVLFTDAHINQINIVDLDDGVFGDEGDEGLALAASPDIEVFTGEAAYGADTCLFDSNRQRCAGGLFAVTRTIIGVNEPAAGILFILAGLMLTLSRRRRRA